MQFLPQSLVLPSGHTRLPWLAAAVLMVLAGCASSPGPTGPASDRGGRPPVREPQEAGRAPGAMPRIEPLADGPNRPYTVLGRTYVPTLADESYPQQGLASWYGRKFHGRRTSSGEIYDMHKMTAAHPTLPIPSYVRVHYPATGKSLVVRVNDRGPFVRGRIIDLSHAAALELGLLVRGTAEVGIERITHAEIRAASRRTGEPDAAQDVAEAEPEVEPPSRRLR